MVPSVLITQHELETEADRVLDLVERHGEVGVMREGKLVVRLEWIKNVDKQVADISRMFIVS